LDFVRCVLFSRVYRETLSDTVRRFKQAITQANRLKSAVYPGSCEYQLDWKRVDANPAQDGPVTDKWNAGEPGDTLTDTQCRSQMACFELPALPPLVSAG
jgi:hypothetical protein